MSLSLLLAGTQVAYATDGAEIQAPPQTAPPDQLGQAQIQSSLHIRDILGFPTDPASMDQLAVGEGLDAFHEHGFLLSRAELAEYNERQRVSWLNREASEYAATLPAFAGVISHRGGDVFEYRFTELADANRQRLRELFPDPARLSLTTAQFSLEYLEAQLLILEQQIAGDSQAGNVAALGVSIEGNELFLVAKPNSGFVPRPADFSASLTVPVNITFGESTEEVCTTRESCNSPQRAGVKIDRFGFGSCSSGYIMRTTSGNEMALTAGHCFYGQSSGNITSGGASFGTLTGWNVYGPGSFSDSQLVETANSSTYNWVYKDDFEPARTVGQRHQISDTEVGDVVCVFGSPESPNCGSVDEIGVEAYGEECQCMLEEQYLAFYGSDGGNSGGAVGSSNGYTAVGVHAGRTSGLGRFSHIGYAAGLHNVYLSTTP